MASQQNVKLEKARLALRASRERQRNAKLARSRGQLLQKMAAKTPQTPRSSTKLEEFFRDINEHRRQIDRQQNKAEFVYNMFYNLLVPERQRRYTKAFLKVCMLATLISLPCYKLLREFFILPAYNTLWTHMRQDVLDNRGFITDINVLPAYLAMIKSSREKERVSMESGGFLAVDAISVRPHITVTRDGFVEGVLGNTSVNSTVFQELQCSVTQYEAYLKTLANKTITDSFVYHYQPINPEAKSFVVFVEPSTQGKATAHEIDRLSELAGILEEAGFIVEGFAFDGDTTYSKLHRILFDSYYDTVVQDVDFENFSIFSQRSIVSDPLHLIKRARYRLLSANVHGGFANTSESIISVERLREQFDVPSVVFSSEKYTKMQDSLAVQMFSLENLAKLFEMRNISALSFFLLVSLLTVALREQVLTVQERLSLLELGYFYMLGYYGCSQEIPGSLPHAKTARQNHVRAFDLSFVREYCNTVYGILRVLHKTNGTIALNRIGSNPLEHLFGLVRMKSKSVHTFDRMIQVLPKVMLFQKVMSELGVNQQIDKRVSYFAQDVTVDQRAISSRTTAARETAFSLHCMFGNPITVRNLMIWDSFAGFELAGDRFDDLRTTILSLARRSREPQQKPVLTSTPFKPSTGSQIHSRLSDRSALG